MSKKIEIHPVEGITVTEIVKAISMKKIYVSTAPRWNTQGGGYKEIAVLVSTRRIKTYRPRAVDFYSPSNGPFDAALTRAIRFNANRTGKHDTFLSDPRIQRVADLIRDLPEEGIFAVNLRTGAVARCGR